jgi:SAM-dependent methyltransferase
MPRFLKILEQQLRLIPQEPRKWKHAIAWPLKTVRKYRQAVSLSRIVVADDFDQKHGTETSQRVHWTDVSLPSANWIYATSYLPTPSGLLAEIIGGLDIELDRLTFVDLGSGKGRVLLMASQFPFVRIVGVELSPELNAIAQRNVRAYQGEQQCRAIDLVCADFAKYEFPREPLFLFLYNPALPLLAKTLAANLMRSLAECPREMWILYVTPSEVFDQEKDLALVRSGESGGHPYRLYCRRKEAGRGRGTA